MNRCDEPSSESPRVVRDPVPVERTRHEFNLTIINDAGLSSRLIGEVRFLLVHAGQVWSEFKIDPFKVAGRELANCVRLLKESLGSRNVLAARLAALLFVCCLVVSVLILERHTRMATRPATDDELLELTQVNFLPVDESRPKDSGVGTGQKGRVGFESGKGEGSKPQPDRARGGGGSGALALLPSQLGKIPQPSEIPAPIPAVARQNPALPLAGINIDPALWKDLPFRNFGDPRSKSTAASNGPGEGGAIGTGTGLGIGEGDGDGFGPGHKRNMGGGDPNDGGAGKGGSPRGSGDDPDRVLTPSQVESRARVISKPEPQYTEAARRNQITGTVVLRVIFTRSGEVTNIRAVSSLPEGLTEKAIAAAREIRFVPATKYGRPVSVYMQLEYNFNLY